VDGLGELQDLVGQVEQLLVLPILLLDRLPLLVGQHLPLLVRPVLADITNVDRKIASSDTIIVSSPKGYCSTLKPIHAANQTTWMYTNCIEPANRVIWSATRFSRLCRRCSACLSSAGLIGMGGGLMLTAPPLDFGPLAIVVGRQGRHGYLGALLRWL
jgi:hypothetical protein